MRICLGRLYQRLKSFPSRGLPFLGPPLAEEELSDDVRRKREGKIGVASGVD